MSTRARSAAMAARGMTGAMAIAFSCRSPLGGEGAPSATTSPQARAEPAPLVTPPAPPTALDHPGAFPLARALPDAGPPPEPLRLEALLPDVVRGVLVVEAARDAHDHEIRDARDVPETRLEPRELREGGTTRTESRELAGYELVATLRTGEVPGPAKAPEVNAAAIEAARRRSEARLAIEFSATRARYVLGPGFVLPPGTELRARSDRYGHLVFWPESDSSLVMGGARGGEPLVYRVAQPGVLRALLGERRLDVAPLSAAEIHPAGEGPRRLNLRTHRLEVATRAGKAVLELATLRDAAEGGALVCRLLFDLLSAAPSPLGCETDDVPLHAELHWTTRGALAFDVTSLVRRTDLVPADLETPPPASTFTDAALPFEPADLLVTRADLASLRTIAVDVTAPSSKADGGSAEGAGLVLSNASDELRVAWIDGIPAAWVGPGERLTVASLVRGRYAFQWRTFLGDAWEPAESATVPGRTEVGGTPGR